MVLLIATVIGLWLANSEWADEYIRVLHHHLAVGIGSYQLDMSVLHWINDGLMVIFFFVVGLEIKREIAVGELRNPKTAALPLLAALMGMIVPALIFVAVVHAGDGLRGWGIPMATDIAFAVGILALLGSRIPATLKMFLLTLAIADDVGAIIVIAVFYSGPLAWWWLAGTVVAVGAMLFMRLVGFKNPLWFVPLGIVVWVTVLESGVHATIAGVLLGLMTPAYRPQSKHEPPHTLRLSQAEQVEHFLHPWSAYLVIPLFAIANAGVHLSAAAMRADLSSRVTWGIILGLVVGKWVGVSGGTLAFAKLRLGRLPTGVQTRHVIGVGAIAGIGFTVALFIATLAYPPGVAYAEAPMLEEAKFGILCGSLIAGIVGALLLSRRPRRR